MLRILITATVIWTYHLMLLGPYIINKKKVLSTFIETASLLRGKGKIGQIRSIFNNRIVAPKGRTGVRNDISKWYGLKN